MLLPWVALQPSMRERHWRRAGQAIAGLAAVALGAAALKRPFDIPLLLLALGAAFVAWRAGRRRKDPIEIGVDGDGVVRFRDMKETEHCLECAFSAPWLITLRHGAMLLPIWPDSLPETTFRRLWVHLRWSRGARVDRQVRANDADRR